jgi:hypothetical protein
MGGSFSSRLVFPFAANSGLIVDPNTELVFAASAQCFQPIASNRSQIFE